MDWIWETLRNQLDSLEQSERHTSLDRRRVEIAREYVRRTEVEFRSLLRSVDQ